MPRKPKHQAKGHEDQQRERIFRAAQEVFSNKGYRGGTTREIAEKAGVNLAAIHYYWGSKDALFKAVHQHLYDHLLPIFQDLAPRLVKSPAQQLIYEGVSRAADFLDEQPEVARLDVHTVVDKRNYDLPLDSQHLKDLMRLVTSGIEPFKTMGVVHQDVDIEMLSFCVTAAYDYFFAADDLLESFTGPKAEDPDKTQRFKNFITRMLCTYVGIPPPKPKPVRPRKK